MHGWGASTCVYPKCSQGNLPKNLLICILWKSFSLPTVGKKISPDDKNCVRGIHFYIKVY